MMTLNELVQLAENVATNLEDDEIPHVHRNIEQLRKRGETFCNRAAQSDIKAAKLLGNKVGYELSAGLSKTLESLNVVSSYDSLGGVNIEDIPSFLKNEREMAILSSINLTRNNTMNMSYNLCEQAKSDWWKNEKNNILNLLVNSDKLPNLLPLGMNRNISGNFGETTRFSKTILSKEEVQYAREINKYLDNVLGLSEFNENITLPDIILKSESSPMNCNKSTELYEISKLLQKFCESRPSFSQFEMLNARQSDSEFSRQLIDLSLMHLQSEYLVYAHQTIEGFNNFSINQSNQRLVALFVEHDILRQAEVDCFEDETVLGVPVWPLIFSCLRAGLHQEAVTVAKEAASNLGEFHCLLSHWLADHPSSATSPCTNDNARRLSTEYKRRIRASTDPWKRLVYSLVCGCDATSDDNYGAAITTVDDFIWLRLTRVRHSPSGPVGMHNITVDPLDLLTNRSRGHMALESHLSLAQLQKSICDEYGETHFRANQQPLTYCRILLLCQLFEPAMAFLARFDHLRCHAVHLALSLWHSNLLLLAPSVDAPLLGKNEDDSPGLSRLNLIRLVTLYTRKFESSHPKEALDLFYLLRELPGNRADLNGFVSCASSLAVEFGQLELLFSRSLEGADGGSRPGLLARYGTEAAFDTVLEAVAERLRETGRMESVIEVLHLAGRYEEAAADLSELLASVAVSLPGDHPDTARLQMRAEFLLGRISANDERSRTLASVLTVSRFISYSHGNTHGNFIDDADAALAALDQTELLPTGTDAGSVRSATERFRRLPEIVRALLPRLLLGAMSTLRAAARVRVGCPDSLADIRRRACALITFTGQLPYRMPADVYASLSQLELEIK